VNIEIRVCQIIGPAAAGSAGPVPTALSVCHKRAKCKHNTELLAHITNWNARYRAVRIVTQFALFIKSI